MSQSKDWNEWHRPYADPDSPLSQRLRLVQQQIVGWLEERPDQSLTVVSACAGQGLDLLGVLAEREDSQRVSARLLEFDQRNVDAARAAIEAGGLSNVDIWRADAGNLSAYVGAVPADLVLMAGVFGNISDADVQATIQALPQLCAADATVIWTRHREDPDLTPVIRGWFADAGFAELAFHAPEGVLFSVGANRFVGQPQALTSGEIMFRFLS